MIKKMMLGGLLPTLKTAAKNYFKKSGKQLLI
jgi:hypothetical protein